MADQRIQYTENMVGANHPTLTDTLNRMSNVSHETDGTHKFIADTTDSTTTGTGAIVTAGGVGIAKSVNIGANAAVAGTTDASSSTTGSLKTAGGLGVAKAAYIGGLLNVAGAATVTGHVTLEGVTSTGATGTGKLVFDGSPELTTPNIGTPSAGTLTNCTGLPVGSVTGLGTGVATALAVNVGTAGAPVVNGGALGTPSSGTVTNLTGTASININGTVGATTPAAGAFTTLSATSNFTALTVTAPNGIVINRGGNIGSAVWQNDGANRAFIQAGTTAGLQFYDAVASAYMGTWTATALAVTGNITATGSITANAPSTIDIGSTGGYPLTLNKVSGAGMAFQANGVQKGSLTAEASSFLIGGPSAYNAFAITDAGANAVTLSSTGLAVSGSVDASALLQSYYGVLFYPSGGSTANRKWAIQPNQSAYGALDFLVGAADGNTPTLIKATLSSTGLAVAGSVGINISGQPSQRLHLSSAGGCYIQVDNSADSITSYFGTSTTGSVVQVTGDRTFSVFTNGSERATINSTGLAVTGTIKGSTTVGVGNATPAASGAGITFPATQSASSDANTLDDYEEGTWTPVPTNLTVTGTPTYTGQYIKIGRMVFCQLRIQADSIAATAGTTYFSGLLFELFPSSAASCWANNSTGVGLGTGLVQAGSNFVWTPTFSGATDVQCSFSYMTSL